VNRTGPKVSVFKITERVGKSKPYYVRWTINGREAPVATFTGYKAADKFRSQLVHAADVGERYWDSVTGKPLSMVNASAVNVAEYCRTYLVAQWPNIEPRTRQSLAVALVVFVERSAPAGAPAWTVAQRSEMKIWLTKADSTMSPAMARWCKKWSPNLAALDKAALFEIDRRLRLRMGESRSLGSDAARRQANTAHHVLDVAVASGVMAVNEWPIPIKGEDQRKKAKTAAKAKKRKVKDVMTIANGKLVLAAMANHQPASYLYRCISCLGLFGGLRPSETLALEFEDFDLPENGFGSVRIAKALTDAGEDYGEEDEEVGSPKEGLIRTVRISPLVVNEVRGYLARTGITTGPMFRGRTGEVPTSHNWCRALERACNSVGVNAVTPYGCRHFCATHLVNSSVPLGRAAKQLGHEPETLVRYYLHDVEGDEDRTLELIAGVFEE
jgi:integrase